MDAAREDARDRPGGPRGTHGIGIPDFEVTGELGSGIRGTVYTMTDGKRTLAVKVLRRGVSADVKALARFQKGAENRLRHPNIVPIELLGELSDGSVYYAMPFLRGDSLERLLGDLKRGASDRPSLSAFAVGPGGETHPQLPRRAAELFAEVAEGLHIAHREGIVHRRLSPRNLILTPAGRLVITDFGGDGSTEAGDDLAYRAPEQLDPFPEAVGPPADVHALGVILYEALTRRPPFQADNPRDLKDLIQKGRFARPRAISSELPAALEACMVKALALDPQDRYANAGDLASDLRKFLRDEVPAAAAAEAARAAERKGLAARLRAVLAATGPFVASRTSLERIAAAIVLAAILGASFWAGKRILSERAGQTVSTDGAGGAARGVVSLDPGRPGREESRPGSNFNPATELVPSAERLMPPSGGSSAGAAATAASLPTSPGEAEKGALMDGRALTRDLSSEDPAAQIAALTRLEAEIKSRARPADDALLAAWVLHAPDPAVRRRAIATMALCGRSGPLLRLLPVGEGEPLVTVDAETFAVLHGALLAIRDEDAVRVLCGFDLDACEALDQAPASAAASARLDPNLKVTVDVASPRQLTAAWIRARALLDPASLLEAAPRLKRREPLLGALISGLEAVDAPEARDALAAIAREHSLAAGPAALAALSRLGAHAPILDLARSELPASFRESCLNIIGENYAGLYFSELRAFALTSPEPSLRRIAFESLSAFDEPEAILAIPGATQDDELRNAAVAWIERLPPDAAATVLLDLLSHRDIEMRALAARRLTAARSTELLLPLVSRLLASRRETRDAALSILLERGELTRIPGALAVIFGRPRASLHEGAGIIIDDVLLALRRLAASLRLTADDARRELAHLLGRSGLAEAAMSLFRGGGR